MTCRIKPTFARSSIEARIGSSAIVGVDSAVATVPTTGTGTSEHFLLRHVDTGPAILAGEFSCELLLPFAVVDGAIDRTVGGRDVTILAKPPRIAGAAVSSLAVRTIRVVLAGFALTVVSDSII